MWLLAQYKTFEQRHCLCLHKKVALMTVVMVAACEKTQHSEEEDSHLREKKASTGDGSLHVLCKGILARGKGGKDESRLATSVV